MKKLGAVLFLAVGGCSSGYPADQICEERDVRSGYCIKAEFKCTRWAGANMLIFESSEARCVYG